MPKELIRQSTQDNALVVRWGAGDVQISTFAPDQQVTMVRTGGEGKGSEVEPFYGWHTDLGRVEVNKLIRVLRRARDASFGSDA